MNGRLQRVISLLRWLGGGGLAGWLWWRGSTSGAVAVLLLVLAGSPLLLLPGFLWLTRQAAEPGLPRPRLREALRAWWLETWAVLRIFGWLQPWREQAQPDHLPAPEPGRALPRGVLLLHGYTCNRGLWHDWMVELRAQGRPFIALTLEPAFGSIDAYAPAIDAAMQRLQALSGRPPLIVGHSMGGLAARAWWRHTGHDPARLWRLITLGSPHQGSLLARWGLGTNGRQMRRHSDWLRALAAAEPPLLRERMHCLFGHCDQIVLPAGSGRYPGAPATHVAATGHLQLIFAPQSRAAMRALMAAEAGDEGLHPKAALAGP